MNLLYPSQVYGIKGEYGEENSIGGISESTSFLVANETELMVFFGKNGVCH